MIDYENHLTLNVDPLIHDPTMGKSSFYVSCYTLLVV